MSVMKTETGVQFNITNTDLIESISLLMELRDFCKEQEQEQDGKQETIKALTTAIETMQAFWCEEFGEDETDEIH